MIRPERAAGNLRGAIDDGSLDPSRVANYDKLKRELDYLDRRRDVAAQQEQKKLWKRRNKALKQHYKLKGD